MKKLSGVEKNVKRFPSRKGRTIVIDGIFWKWEVTKRQTINAYSEKGDHIFENCGLAKGMSPDDFSEAQWDRNRFGAMTPADVELWIRFTMAAKNWKAETRFMSSVSQMAMNPNYKKIMNLGEKAIPLIIHELQQEPDHWFWALSVLTGSDGAKISEEHAGKVKLMAQDWIDWYYNKPPHKFRAANHVFYHDDPPCEERLNADGTCPACKFVPDMQSLAMAYHCPTCDNKLELSVRGWDNAYCKNCNESFTKE